jgi:hypothetical protein
MADATGMAVTSADDAAAFSPVVEKFREIPSNPMAMTVVTEVLREAWQTTRGRKLAKQIATRDLLFAEFVHAQFRVWVYEGLRVLTRKPGGQLAEGEDEVFWGVAEDLLAEVTSGSLTEKGLMDFLTSATTGIIDPDKWRQVAVATGLSSRLRGPMAYVLGRWYPSPRCPFLLIIPKRTPAAYFEYARQHAADAPCPEALRRALASASTEKP